MGEDGTVEEGKTERRIDPETGRTQIVVNINSAEESDTQEELEG